MKNEEALIARRKYSERIVKEGRKKVGKFKDLGKFPDLCVYATGSYARGEASVHSDLDVFLVHCGEKLPQLTTITLFADVVHACRKLDLPEFSGDGEFLKVHYLKEMKEELGSPRDDYTNFFTARLLLLLESTPLSNEETYKRILTEIIDSYYRDYHDHNTEFRPIFLVNDIVRFWKTLCLNYEHKRNSPPRDNVAKSKRHLKNLKLKFSRLTTCFSAVIAMVSTHKLLAPKDLYKIVTTRPLERLRQVSEQVAGATPIYNRMMGHYAWFLQKTGRPEAQVLNWIEGVRRRDEGFRRAREYGQAMFELLTKAVGDQDTLRYLVI